MRIEVFFVAALYSLSVQCLLLGQGSRLPGKYSVSFMAATLITGMPWLAMCVHAISALKIPIFTQCVLNINLFVHGKVVRIKPASSQLGLRTCLHIYRHLKICDEDEKKFLLSKLFLFCS